MVYTVNCSSMQILEICVLVEILEAILKETAVLHTDIMLGSHIQWASLIAGLEYGMER